jgi:hypothetical protein
MGILKPFEDAAREGTIRWLGSLLLQIIKNMPRKSVVGDRMVVDASETALSVNSIALLSNSTSPNGVNTTNYIPTHIGQSAATAFFGTIVRT